MITEEVKHIFNRMVFFKKKYHLDSVDNDLLLVVLLTEKGSELSKLLLSICTDDEIDKYTTYAIDTFAGHINETLKSIIDTINESNGDIPSAITFDDNQVPQLSTLSVAEDLSYTLLSASGAKEALSKAVYMESSEIQIDTLMLFYGLIDSTNDHSVAIRNVTENILKITDAIIGESLISKFNPSYKSYLLNKKKENKNNIEKGVNVYHAETIEGLRNIMDAIIDNSKKKQSIEDETDDDYEEGENGGTMVKVCNMISPFEERDLIRRDEYTEKIATLMSQYGNKVIAIVGQSGSGLSYFKYLLNEYINQRYEKKFQNLHYHKIFSFNTEYIKSELAKGNEGIISLFYTIGKFLDNNNGILFIDDFGSMFDTEKGEITESSFLNICDWNSDDTPTIIATMTNEQYSEHIEKSASLRKLFNKVEVPVMSDEEVIKCFNIVKKRYENAHLCKIDTDEINHALRLSKKHIKSQAVPSSLLKVIDLAGSITLSRIEVPDDIIDIERKYYDETALDFHQKMNSNAKSMSTKDIDNIYLNIEKKRQKDSYKLRKTVKKFCSDTKKSGIKITNDDIEQAISIITGIPSDQMNDDEIKKVSMLKNNLRNDVIGQDEAIDVVVKTLKRRAVGLSANKSKTIGNLIFCGESGVGKTELAKKLAKYMFGDENNMVRLDMSEYSERHTMSKLIGTSAGFVGYENDGVLTKAVREKKYCVVLLDEMEKSAPEIFNLFLQVFDDGRITTGQGELIDFTNTIIIMTSNVGARKSQEMGDGIGFTKQDNYKHDVFEKELRKTFQPEFLNRIDNIVVFNHLTDDNMHSISKLQLNKLVKTVSETGRKLNYSDEVVDVICNTAKKEENMGARPINRAIQNLIEVPLADLIVDNADENITSIEVSVNDGKIEVKRGNTTQEEKPKTKISKKSKKVSSKE